LALSAAKITGSVGCYIASLLLVPIGNLKSSNSFLVSNFPLRLLQEKLSD